MAEDTFPCAGPCRFHGFLGNVSWCRHPDHVLPIAEMIERLNGDKCPEWREFGAYTIVGNDMGIPDPVNLKEIFQ